jgi:hypothetical protein
MVGPQLGDILIRGTTANGYTVLDAITFRPCAGSPLGDLHSAVALARSLTMGEVWQQSVDHRGRPVGEPLRLTKHHAVHATARDASAQRSCCNRGWICAAHPGEPWPHDECPIAQRCHDRGCPYQASSITPDVA